MNKNVQMNEFIIDYGCLKDNHFYGERYDNDEKIQIKFRLDRFFYNIFLRKGYSEVWSKTGSSNKIKIESIEIPDFSNIDNVKRKITTYLNFG